MSIRQYNIAHKYSKLPYYPLINMKWYLYWIQRIDDLWHCWQSDQRIFPALKIPALSFIIQVTEPGVERTVCLSKRQAAYLCISVSLLAIVWSFLVDSVWLSIPVRMRCWIFLKARCPMHWCHLSSSFFESVRLMLSLWTEVTVWHSWMAGPWTSL